MQSTNHTIPSLHSMLVTGLLFSVGIVVVHRVSDYCAGFIYRSESLSYTIFSSIITLFAVIAISMTYRLSIYKKMVHLAKELKAKKMDLSRSCPGFRSEHCTGKKIYEHAAAVLASVPRLTALLNAHLNETTSITETATISIIQRLTDVQKESAGLFSSLCESKLRAENIHVNAEQQIALNKNQVVEVESYQTRRENQIKGDTAAIQEVVTLIAGLKPLTDLIHDIASQLKLLSLNAVIEATRAGVKSGGFTVVASEMKTLTRQCEEASEKVDRGIQKVSETVNDNLGNVIDAKRISSELGWLSSIVKLSANISSDFQIAVTELQQLSHDSYRTVESISHSIVEVLENAQFQDISRQQIEQVQAGLTMCGDQMVGILSILGGECDINSTTTRLDDSYKLMKSNYTMKSQRMVHEQMLSGTQSEQSDNHPDIELF